MLPVAGLYESKTINVHQVLAIICKKYQEYLRQKSSKYLRTFSLSPNIRRPYKKESVASLTSSPFLTFKSFKSKFKCWNHAILI